MAILAQQISNSPQRWSHAESQSQYPQLRKKKRNIKKRKKRTGKGWSDHFILATDCIQTKPLRECHGEAYVHQPLLYCHNQGHPSEPSTAEEVYRMSKYTTLGKSSR